MMRTSGGCLNTCPCGKRGKTSCWGLDPSNRCKTPLVGIKTMDTR